MSKIGILEEKTWPYILLQIL